MWLPRKSRTLPNIGLHGATAIADAVEIQVHGAEPHDLIDDINAGESFVP
jgi:hypothetical protein